MLTRQRRDLEQRFARERDILASLEHPHIARLYDAGIDADGLPYLAMEYVEGQQLTNWCDSHMLGIPERLELFLQVLDAVQYAHDRQVIHRDLKPSNILVTEAQQVRLLDFGVAKLLHAAGMEQTEITRMYGHAMTPVYASPELLCGDPIDARSDIYSLGVLLYEILTGSRPYRLKDTASLGMQAHLIAGVNVKKPSTQLLPDAGTMRSATQLQLARQLRGDLDAIVLKGLAKEPGERYPSAAAMAEDLRRSMRGEPIRAQPARIVYRAGKFARRNRVVIGATAAAAAAILAAAGYTLHREAATQSRIETRAVAMLSDLKGRVSEKSVAVLPFVDLSERKDQEYFSDGLTEELINRLAQIQDLQVIARTSSFYFKGKQVPAAEIGGKLGVAHLLEGSVRRAGSTVRVNAQLIRADSAVQVWSQSFDRDVKDIFRVQDEIAAAVVGALKLRLLPEQQVVDPYRSDNPEAYNQFLLAKQFGRRGNLDDYRRALAAYRKAIELDPHYAAGHAGVSFIETRIANFTQDAAGFERARDSAERALALAPQLVDGYRARASYRLETLDFAGARADWERALAIEPRDSMVQGLYGVGLALFGRIPEATTAARRAIELDPLNSYAWAYLGIFQTMGRDYLSARRSLDRALAISPDDYSSHWALGQLDLLEGRLDDASNEFQRKGNEAASRMGEAMVEHARGRAKQSQFVLRELIARHARENAYQIGDVYAWRGEKDRAFEWLERAYRQRDSGLNGLNFDPLLADLHDDPRYQALLKKLKLSD
jgi:TolB-like protein/Tfp pilus assembly protein PilF